MRRKIIMLKKIADMPPFGVIEQTLSFVTE